LQTLIRKFSEDRDFQSIISGFRSGMREQLVAGLAGSSRPVLIAALARELNQPMLIVTHNLYAAQKIAEDLLECLSADEVLLYPAQEVMSTELMAASPESLTQRIEVLTRLALGFRGVIIAPFAGVRKLLPVSDMFRTAMRTVRVGDTVELGSLLEHMTHIGYVRVDRVEAKGELSVRGGIVDFFPLTSSVAYRIELFDNEVDSIRSFDPVDQRSIEKWTELVIMPCQEIIADRKRSLNAAEHAYDLLQEQLGKMNDRSAKQKLQSTIMHEIEQLRENQSFSGLHKYIALLYPERQTLLDYVPKDTILLIDEPTRLVETARQLEREEADWLTGQLQDGKSLPAYVMAKTYDSMLHRKPFPTLYITLFLRQLAGSQPQNIVNFVCRTMQNFHGQMHLLKSETERWKKSGHQLMIVVSGEERLDRVKRVLEDYKIEKPFFVSGNLQNGFELPSIRLVVLTEGEMFSQKQRKAARKPTDRKIDNAERIKSYQELKVGDYVVHINHGIGKYIGISTIEVGGIHKDYLHILYDGGDKLSVPIDQFDLIQKYVGSEEKEPKIYKLGGAEWNRVKSKVRSSVKDIADDLIKLYAARQSTLGYRFSKDSSYQQEFESMFPYEETRDQLRAIKEIKADMEKPQPMDRLLCGDVGYGKTEVAIRAAFKAAIDGKQVAVLVPTTILAQQHYETFRERFSGYPIQIQVMSRFRSKKEQADTMKGVKQGTIDVIIGTHRLLSADIEFKDLGLLIVDEEQRFGVSHKEKLKKLKTNVDVLTLTATPIPRTLHMSMLGVRDLSVIETPPENRFPVQTYVVEYGNSLVREAIERELAREGQVYFLYNRVQGIQQMADQISTMVPDARVAVAHGQMNEQELEKTILDFLDGEFDVLVSTSIIETGVDIPNVNTLIIHDADKMGLSQLYQLRGRVGRSNRIAYAYFTYQRDKVLTEIAEKRLQAIKEFTELGSGFKIAMRDLSIRGAGNLLGAEQHGFIASVGFDLYSKMLTDEISLRKKELATESTNEQPTPWKMAIDIQLDAYLPGTYIYDSMQKIEVYKKTASLTTLEEIEELQEELIDRFGDLPQAVGNLLSVVRIKAYGALYAIESLTQRGEVYQLKFDPSQNGAIEARKLVALIAQFNQKIKVVPGPQIHIEFNGKGLKPEESISLLESFLLQYKEVLIPKGELQNATT
jgi:transcription-repair coupling factor (superfamily II helicase)